jgi:NAD(P)-dependent dehydrogenase (short-subunit alcohol dehydrogenase family)
VRRNAADMEAKSPVSVASFGTGVREVYRASVPVGRMGTPEDIAHAVGFFASDAARLHHRPAARGRRRRALGG